MRIALCGLGPWGRTFARTLDELGVLACGVDPSAEARAAARVALPGLALSGSFARALAADVDAVVITTPAVTHARLTLAALAAEKHVLCEKPLAMSLVDAREVRAGARAVGRIVLVGHVLEYAPATAALRDRIARGAIGAIVAIDAERRQAPRCGRASGPLWELAVHDVGLVTRTVRAPIERVVARAHGPAEVEISLDFAGGIRAELRAGTAASTPRRKTVVRGERGWLELDELDHALIERDCDGVSVAVPYAATQPLRLECEAFLTAIRAGTPPPSDVDMGVDVVRVLDAAASSIALGGAPMRLC